MSKPSRIIVLVEDQEQQRFVRKFLYRSGFRIHEIRFEPLPAGGSGEQWVRARYAPRVRDYRRRSASADTALIVVIDADTHPVTYRENQLQKELTRADLNQRERQEKIVHWIPRRNIETWILCLVNQAVEEETDYSQNPTIGKEIPAAAKAFYEWTRPHTQLPDHCIPSLRTAVPEAQRLG